MSYDHKLIDPKWQKKWADAKIFEAKNDLSLEKFYLLVEFPYPSGAGLHVGHPRSYTALDVLARKRRMEGKNVLFPMGWDAFGLPAENYAIKTGIHPSIVTKENIATFRRQLQSIGFSFDWSREVDTTDPKYYRWTQWMFLEFFKAGLCYKAKMPINWCSKCKIGLANEEAAGGVCERCGNPVEKREKEQWMIAMTKYADRLLEDLRENDYLPKIKKEQEEWIGRSEGAEIDFIVDGYDEKITVFTTRPDTVFGVTYVVLAPEHPLVSRIATDAQRVDVMDYVAGAAKKTDTERGDIAREKTGVFTGAYVVNPVNGERVPVWVADYVLGTYGTGAVMAVPAHDERDFAFAKKYSLKMNFVVEHSGVIHIQRSNLKKNSVFPDFVKVDYFSSGEMIELSMMITPERVDQLAEWILQNVHNPPRDLFGFFLLDSQDRIDVAIALGYKGFFNKDGKIFNSSFLNGLDVDSDSKRIVNLLEKSGCCRAKVTYRLRDWVFSRQRYWGEPIPLVKCASGCGGEQGGWVPVPDAMLPVELPQVEKYEPTDTGESPLSSMPEWVNTKCPQCGGLATRETDTMPNWAGSSWYFLRYIDAHNDEVFAKKDLMSYWLPVDLYNGGMEHATRHLLYARFWTKVLFDRGHIPCNEFAKRRIAHGLILGEDGQKMSKSKGNVVNPDDIVEEYGADTLRLYELFMGPFDEAVPWSTNGVIGVRRFLDKVLRLVDRVRDTSDAHLLQLTHKTLKKVSEDSEALRFNTAIAAMMALANELSAAPAIPREVMQLFARMLVLYAPHVANEVWEKLGATGLVEAQVWPRVDTALLVSDEVTLAIQVNGKVRGSVTVATDAADDAIIAAAQAQENVVKHLAGQAPKKVIIIPGKIVSFVV